MTLFGQGFVDVSGYEQIQKYAYMTKIAVDSKKWNEATNLWGRTESVLLEETHNIDFYNVLFKVPSQSQSGGDKITNLLRSRPSLNQTMYRSMVSYSRADDETEEDRDARLQVIMRTQVHEALGLPEQIVWGSQSGKVFETLAGDFMKPVTHIVEQLLNSTSIQVCFDPFF